MATVTKPIALDESFNTTEATPRNIADVLAKGIGDLIHAVSQIAPQTVYDLDDLGNVDITSPSNGQVLKYNGTSQKWENGTGGGSGDSVSWSQIVQTGTKIAEIEINGQTTDVYAPTGGGGFSALIVITAATGQTVTVSKGGDTYTAVETSSGTYEVSVDSMGTWTVTDGTNTDTVTVSQQTTYYVTLSSVPDGKTVLPTDDVSIWLACGGRSEAYTTLPEVLNDSVCLSSLIADSNAVDYLVRSTTWASGITTDSSAMSYIGLNNYASNTLLADSTWCNAICNSAYFESVLNVKIPAATGYTVANGVCSANSERGNYYAWYAIDGTNIESHVWSPSNTTGDSWWQFKFNSPVNIKKVTSNQYKRQGGSWAISYSADGVDFTNKIAQGVFSETAIDVNINANTHINTNAEYYRWEYTNMPERPVMTRCQFYGRADI